MEEREREEREEGRRLPRLAPRFVDDDLNQIVEGLANNRRMLEDRQDQLQRGRERRREEAARPAHFQQVKQQEEMIK